MDRVLSVDAERRQVTVQAGARVQEVRCWSGVSGLGKKGEKTESCGSRFAGVPSCSLPCLVQRRTGVPCNGVITAAQYGCSGARRPVLCSSSMSH